MVRVSSAVLACLFLMGSGFAWSQESEFAAQPAPHRVSFSYDPVHSAILATPAPTVLVPGKIDAAPADTAAATTYTGTIAITFTIKLISAVPKGATLHCGANVGLEYSVETQVTSGLIGLGGALSNTSESVEATVAGSTATCRFSIPYSWTVPASTPTTTVTISGITGSVGVSEGVSESPVIGIAFAQTSTAVTNVSRSTSVELTGPTTIPADGTTTSISVSTVL
jgi:hypothetical protein